MTTRYRITANGDQFVRTKRELTLSWTDLGTAIMRIYARYDLPGGIYDDIPAADGQVSAATRDSQGNVLYSLNLVLKANTVFVRITNYNQPFNLWIG